MKTALDYANGFVGLRETNSKNRSPQIDVMNALVHNPLGSPYCAAGVSYCFHQSLLSLHGQKAEGDSFTPSGSSQALKKAFDKSDRYSEDPQDLLKWRGALGGWTSVGDPAHGHIFFVAGRLTDKSGVIVAIQTIEFNTSIAGSRDGEGVYELRRVVPIDRGHKLWFLDTSEILGGQWWTE